MDGGARDVGIAIVDGASCGGGDDEGRLRKIDFGG